HQVQSLRGIAQENDFARVGEADKSRHLLPRRFVQLGRLFGQRVNRTMHVGVGQLVVVADGLDHCARLLRRGGIVEINQTTPSAPSLEDRKVAAYQFAIECHCSFAIQEGNPSIQAAAWIAPFLSRRGIPFRRFLTMYNSASTASAISSGASAPISI